ncbi:Ig-like domain-containing protein [Staphylococcus pettenkoferi]|uniref:Ig-like domain-containing protein n=1 Tax=Staphylococcus pettenkoferi TaxID=170573 RepID=UPI0022727F07|nr:Ig-like domain-containing protein [Staphylococcus pettenkoferi]MCY1598651.1 Ig-like domain-containing protein [Staphylococcus pettenkoferi]MCY1622503.1 Ig-like domain-containing protein [Staphylococcus pettenkoferi]
MRLIYVNLNGKSHVYNATDGQYYRLWIEDFETPNGNTATMLRQVDGLIPGTFVNSVTHLNLGQFPLIGKNMQRTGVFMGVRPTNDYMTRPKEEWIHDEEGPMTNPYTDLKAKNTVSGRVWLETGDGDEANSGTGPNRNPGDPVAQGYTVVMSSLTKEGAAAYKDQVQSLDHGQRAEAAKKLLEDHPEYISATVYGETDEDGHYTLRFPKDALDVNFLYGYVMDKDGVIQNAYSSYTAPEFRTPNTNALFTPQAIPAHNLVADPMWYNVHFAVIPRTDVEISIVDFNNTDKPAAPGDVAHIDLEGKILSPLPTHVEWRDSKGKVVKKTPDFTSLKEGEDAGTFEIPADAKDGDHYTAVLVVNDRDVSADSLTVKVTDAHTYEPEVTPITKDYGTPTTEDDVKNAVTVPDYPADKGTPKVTIDEGAELPDGNTEGTVNVPVTVTYPDGTTAHVNVPVTTKAAEDNTKMPQVDNVTAGDKTVSGHDGQPGNTVVVTFPGDKTGTATVDDNGKWTVNVPSDVTLKPGDKVTAVEKDNHDHTSPVTEVTVNDTENTAHQPQVDPINGGGTSVGGKGTPGNDVEVTLPGGTKVPGTVDENGNFTVKVPDGTELKPGDKVTVVEKDHNGHTSPATEVTVGDYPNTAHQPTVDPVTAGDKTVHGKGTPGNTVEVTLPGGTVVTGEVDENGNFTVKVPDGTTLKPGDEITVVEKDHHGHASTPTKVTVGDTANEAHQPTVDPIHGGDKTVHGKGTPGNTVEVTLPDGSTVTGEVDKDGNFTIEVPDGKELKPGDKVTVVEKDKDGHSSTPTEVTVGDYPNTAHQPTVDPVTAGDKTVHGKGTPGNTVEVTLPDGSVVTGTVDKDGNFTVKVPDGTTLKPGQVITVVEKDKHGHASTPTKVTVGDTANEAHQPQVDPIHGGDSSIGGKGTPGNTVEVTLPDGSKVTGTIDKDGNFTIDLPDCKELKPGDKVTVVEKDKDGHTSPATEVTVGDYPNTAHQPTVDPIHSGDKTVTGKGTPGNTIELTTPCGKTLTTKVDKDGNWSIDLPEDVHLKAGDKVTVVEKDQYGHTSTPTVVTVTDKEMNGNNCDMPKKDDNGQAPMDNHGSDMNKGDMTEHASTPAMTQGSDMAQGHDDSMKHAEAKDDAKSEAKALPETGNTDNSGTIFGSLFAALGALFLAGRRRKKEDK